MMQPQRGSGMGDIGHDRRLDYICSSPRLGQRCTINHQQSNRRILRGLRVVPSNVSLSTAWSWAQACALQCSSVHLGGTLTLQPILILNGYGVAIWKTLLKNLVTDHCQTSWAWACVGPAWGLAMCQPIMFLYSSLNFKLVLCKVSISVPPYQLHLPRSHPINIANIATYQNIAPVFLCSSRWYTTNST